MKNKIFFIIMKILNYSVFFHTSLDDNFDTVEKTAQTDFNFSSIRISLLFIPFGEKIFYILTFKKKQEHFFEKENFKLSYTLDYDLKWMRMEQNTIELRVKDYKEHIDSQSIEKTKEQECFLKQRISENNDSMSAIRNKITHYTTVMLALSGALTYIYTKMSIANTPNFISFIFIYLLIIITFQIINLALFLRKGMMINSFYQSSFKDLKNSDYKYELSISLYRDWLSRCDDVRYFAGIVKNAEKYLYRSICIGVVAFIIISLFPGNVSDGGNISHTSISDTYVYNIL